MLKLKWSDLGPPTKPGWVGVEDVGVVEVSQADLDAARLAGGRLDCELREDLVFGDRLAHYRVQRMVACPDRSTGPGKRQPMGSAPCLPSLYRGWDHAFAHRG